MVAASGGGRDRWAHRIGRLRPHRRRRRPRVECFTHHRRYHGATESSDFPTGYHQLNELVAARPERLLVRDDTVFVSFSTAVRAGLDPAGTSSFSGGLWRLSLDDGRSIDSFGEFLDPFAPGVFTLAFPINGYGVDDITEVQLTGEVVRAGASHVMQLTFDSGLPWTGTPDGNWIPLQGVSIS